MSGGRKASEQHVEARKQLSMAKNLPHDCDSIAPGMFEIDRGFSIFRHDNAERLVSPPAKEGEHMLNSDSNVLGESKTRRRPAHGGAHSCNCALRVG